MRLRAANAQAERERRERKKALFITNAKRQSCSGGSSSIDTQLKAATTTLPSVCVRSALRETRGGEEERMEFKESESASCSKADDQFTQIWSQDQKPFSKKTQIPTEK